MKQTLLITALLITTVLAFAQAPQGINYQAAVRDAGGNELSNQAVSLRMTILENNTTTVYQETHSATTNGFGLVNLVIGQGTATQGAFNSIDWSTGNYFAQTEVDVTGGSNYALMGSQQLMSVPYALYAESAGGASLPTGTDNQTIRYNGGGWEADSLLINTGIAVGIGRQNPDDLLHIYGTDPNLIIQDTETTSTLAESYAIFAESGVSGGWTSYNWKIGYDRKNFTFNYTNASTENEFMRIDPDGKVGIGTTSPQERLHVDGQIRMTTGAIDGYIIQGDADGTMSWVDPATTGGGSGNLNISVSQTGDTLYFGNGQWVLIGGLSTLNGILWGEDVVYTVGQGVTDIDGNEYETVIINGQEWMAENLCTSSFQNGDPLTLQTTNPGWGNATSEAYCWYDNNQAYEADYCKLYNWYAATDPRELCPVGWRVPTAEDWEQLIGGLDPTCNPCTNGGGAAINALKEAGSLLWSVDNSQSTNSSGFSARAGGRRDGGGSSSSIGETVYFWTSTPAGSQARGVYFLNDFNVTNFDEDWGMSIRCIKD